ncbi:hypothetical protein HC028_02730 [Planosporangium flavigriseum]|uniref:NACHT domain-containing protein n=1 Tax=Planosporangium flavigriseum TaxID=373681 RepID=UPI00143CA6F3|nr:hypothetical protein [Planosporangium flavigriseum]NJC63430.1 hypothetical protein [Planosporangium flavigriseum]
MVFQVKFAKAPVSIDDPVKWLKRAIDGELEKLEKLVVRGMQQYVLITNLSATAHLDTGRVDLIQEYLRVKAPVDAICWWREDLDRRLESAYDLKLRYPATLNGSDLLRLIWETVAAGDSAGRRHAAINAYLGHHHKLDSTIRFKQVELVSKSLFELYVDVPARVVQTSTREGSIGESEFNWRRLAARAARRTAEAQRRNVYYVDDVPYYADRHGRLTLPPVGAADLLMDRNFAAHAPLVVLEGAPGQGKSTLTQYLAQIQRVRILDRKADVAKLPRAHQQSQVLLPFRMELRDLAVWLRGEDPWAAEPGTRHDKPPTLEGALSAHIARYSGGVAFDVSDLHQILGQFPSIFLLDALDEVADLDDRRAVVEAVTESLARFEGNSIRPRVVVTTRPTSIVGSPNFPEESFMRLSLASLEEFLALEYTRRWAKARRLEGEEKQRLPQTLTEKMQAPHIAELAKNTMQLSILLSLLQRRGASLPDKRTELYTAYFDIFLDRESEKSEVVRDNRALLFDLHRFLGFHLHAIAEETGKGGRISLNNLRELLSDYLTKERQPHDLVDALLKGVVERFGALVSRVEGQYEFEVQPLQEYFAGRHLYDTAPYSPPGRERRGTLPDRFDGVAPNPYWMNVTRFLAGCFSKGELADLAERVCTLIRQPEQKLSPFPRSLAVALLQDWVFSQSPKATEQVVDAVFDEVGLTWAITGKLDPDQTPERVLRLPKGGGAEYLAEICWKGLLAEGMTERAQGLCALIRRNSHDDEIRSRWLVEYGKLSGTVRTDWVQVGVWLGVMGLLNRQEVRQIIDEMIAADSKFIITEICLTDADTSGLEDSALVETVRAVLDSPSANGGIVSGAKAETILSYFSGLVQPSLWYMVSRFRGWRPTPFPAELRRQGTKGPTVRSLKRVSIRMNELLLSQKFGDVQTFGEACAALEEAFGRSWTSIEIALVPAALSRLAKPKGTVSDLVGGDEPLYLRFMGARAKSSDLAWWDKQRSEAASEYDIGLWLLGLALWADVAIIAQRFQEIDAAVRDIGDEHTERVLRAADRAVVFMPERRRSRLESGHRGNVSVDALCLVRERLAKPTSRQILRSRFLEGMKDSRTASAALAWLVEDLGRGRGIPTEELLGRMKIATALGGTTGEATWRKRFSVGRLRGMVEQVFATPQSFPPRLLEVVSNAVLDRGRKMPSVLSIGEEQGWFSETDA